MDIRLLHGNSIALPENVLSLYDEHPGIEIPLLTQGQPDVLALSEEALSRHVLIVGGIGSGKTNLFHFFLQSLSRSLTEQDIMVVFDTKGEYLDRFYRPGDIILANSDNYFPFGYNIDYWNIFEELFIDRRNLKDNANEISRSLFFEQAQRTNNPFFPNAARDIFFAYLLATARRRLTDGNASADNWELSSFFNQRMDAETLASLFETYPDLKSVRNYISTPGTQTQGVLSEVIRLVRDVFTGNFEKRGSLSIRQAVRAKGGRRIFVEYDLGMGNVLAPVYRLLMDLAIKEALCRDRSPGNVYFILDEFRLLPHLQHVDDGINFGRSQGTKFIIGLQNIQQLREAYGENAAGSILSGLSNKFVFHVNDHETRTYVQDLLGKNRYVESFYSQDGQRGLVEELVDGNTAEDWVISRFPIGYCIYVAPGKEPVVIQTPLFQSQPAPGCFTEVRRELSDVFRLRATPPEQERASPGAFRIRSGDSRGGVLQ